MIASSWPSGPLCRRCVPCRLRLSLTWPSSTPTRPACAGYWDELVPRVRQGGVLLVDNVLWSGRVLDQGDTVALRKFNDMVAGDERVEVVVLTAFDGLTIARKL